MPRAHGGGEGTALAPGGVPTSDQYQLLLCSVEAPRPGSAIEAHLVGLASALPAVCPALRVETLFRAVEVSRLGRLVAWLEIFAKVIWRAPRANIIYMRWHPLGFPLTLFFRMLRRPYALEVNGTLEDIQLAHPQTRFLNCLLRLTTRTQFAQAAHIFTVTPGLRDWIRNFGVRPEGVTVLANGAPSALRAHRRVQAHPPYAVFVGELAPWQGLLTLVEAARSEAWPRSLDLVIIGNGIEADTVRQAAEDLDHVTWLGRLPRDEARDILAGATISVSPQGFAAGRNRFGVSPIKVSESLLLGVPVVLSSLNTIAREIESLGLGASHEPDDVSGLARAVCRAIALGDRPDHRSRVADFGLEHCSWDGVAGSTADVLLSLVARSARGASAPGR